MAAPFVIAVIAFLTGGAGYAAGTYGGTAVAAVKDEAVVAEIYADLPLVCARAQPALHALVKANPKGRQLARISVVTDAICTAAHRPDNPLSQALLILDAMRALKEINAKLDPAPSVPPATVASTFRDHAGGHRN